MRSIRKHIIGYWLGVFRLPKVRNEMARYALAFSEEATRYTSGIRGEAAETREMFLILARYIRKERLSREDKSKFKTQVIDILKGVGVVVPPMLIPLPFVGTLLLVIMDQLLLSLHIKILPSSFYPDRRRGIMTPEGIEEEFVKQFPERKPKKPQP